jgi:hypothetical protein
MELVLILGVIVLLNVFAFLFGADTRDGDDWVKHRPV